MIVERNCQINKFKNEISALSFDADLFFYKYIY